MDFPCLLVARFASISTWLHNEPEVELIMKHSRFRFGRLVAVTVLSLAGLCSGATANPQTGAIQVGRYSLWASTPTEAQVELLAATVTVQFPERIQTVGAAVRHALQGSGYRLAEAQATAPGTAGLFALPLPAVHRSLGPTPLRAVLETLAGPAFHLVQDPVHRLVSFDGCLGNPSAVRDITTPRAKGGGQDED